MFEVVSVILAASGSLLGLITKYFAKKKEERSKRAPAVERVEPEKDLTGKRILIVFSIIVLVFGVATLIIYWDTIKELGNTILFGAWLFIAMVAGMFIQVIVDNYKKGDRLFTVSWEKLVFPLLFSLIVFFPIWTLAASAPKNLFSIYTAFLNGYFWETVVAKTRLSE